MTNNTALVVIYLVWIPYGRKIFDDFIESYLSNEAGMPHQLFLLFNGVNQEEVTREYCDYAKSRSIQFDYLTLESGQDIDAYFFAAKELKADRILFLNTFSQFRAAGWLKKFDDAFNQDPSVGLVSASGSCQSYYSSVFQKNSPGYEAEKGWKYNFRKYKLFVKAFFYWRVCFKPFPNPHARTNAFMVRRSEFLAMNFGPVRTKFRAYCFESGRRGMTNYYFSRGQMVWVVDKNGQSYAPHEWKDSLTFWSGHQENLLVSDNQTRIYDEASETEKIAMTKLAWGNG